MSDFKESEKQYLAWYYDHLISVSKVQARLAWIVFILLIFSVLLLEQGRQYLTIPFINLDFSVEILQIILPIVLSFIFWEYLGSFNAVSISVKNIQFRMKNLEYKADEFNLYNIDTYLNFLDIITFNFKKHVIPGTKNEIKKYDWRHLPYLSYSLIFISVKIYLLINYNVIQFFKCVFGVLIIIDIIFAFPLIKDRIKRFFNG
jgi:hypothetical protein